jgi:hypothetical protein
MGIMRIFAELDWSFAVVGAINTSIDLNRTEDWPLYARVAVSSTYLIGSTVQMFRRFGWTKVLEINGKEPWGTANHAYFKELTRSAGIGITNPEDLRGIPFSVNRETISDFDENLMAVVNSDTVPFIIISFSHFP